MPALSLWSGWEARGGTTASDGATERFIDSLARSSPREAAYELLAVAARGFHPPRFVTVGPWSGGADAETPEVGPAERADRSGFRLGWSLVYRRLAETGPPGPQPYAIYLLGVDPPADTSEQELLAFNDFYTNVHLVEVAERRRALRAERFELVEVLRSPHPKAPRFLAVYEVDEAGASRRRHSGPPYSNGPDVWQRHTTPWRLWYKRLAP